MGGPTKLNVYTRVPEANLELKKGGWHAWQNQFFSTIKKTRHWRSALQNTYTLCTLIQKIWFDLTSTSVVWVGTNCKCRQSHPVRFEWVAKAAAGESWHHHCFSERTYPHRSFSSLATKYLFGCETKACVCLLCTIYVILQPFICMYL